MKVNITQINQPESAMAQRNADLGKNEFMNILVTQLRFQDPLRPMDDREFISQMAQFSALEQMQNLNTEFLKTKAINLIGRNVSAKMNTDEQEVQLIHGLVESVSFEDGRTFVLVNERNVAIEDIVNIRKQPLGSYSEEG